MCPAKLKKSMNQFINYLVVYKHVSPVTAKGYARSLSIALRRMRKYIPSYDDITEYVMWMRNKEYSYSHVTNSMLALEHYMKIKGQPIELSRPRKPKRILKDLLTESEVSRMIVASKNCVRRQAMITLLAYSGIRSVEFCALKVSDIDLGANEIRVIGGKNRKDRITNISAECTNVLIKYLASYPRKNEEFLFTTLRKGNQLAPADLRKHIKILAKQATVSKRTFPHLLRHSLASSMLSRGANIILIKNQLGHVFIETTMLYLQSMSYREKSQYDFYKPAYM
jgi:integrase/recombinase XerD